MNTNVVIVDDVRSDVATLEEALIAEPEFSVTYTPWIDSDEIARVLESIKRERSSVILLDVFFDGEEKGDKIYRLLKQANDNAQVIVLSVRDDIATQRKYINMGAYDYVIKDSSPGVIRNVIARIKLAGDEGVQCLAEFEGIDQLFTNEPEHALYLFEALFEGGFNNLDRSKKYAARLRGYLGRSFDRIQFPIARLLEMMITNSQRIETADPSDYENLIDMAALYLHRGDERNATQVFRKLLFGSEAPSNVTNKVFSWLENLHYGQTRNLPNVAWLRTKLIDEKNQDEQRILITALRDYKQNLWQDALCGWFEVLENLWDQGDKEQAAKLVVWLLREYGAGDILDGISSLAPTSRGEVLQLCEGAARLAANGGTNDLDGLVALLELLFEARDVSDLSETEKRTYLEVLEQTLLLTLDSDESSEENATRIYKMMSKLQFSTAEMIQNVRSNMKSELPNLWNKYLLNGIKYLNTTGKASELHSVINSNKDDLFNTLEPDALAEMGGILDEAKSPLSGEFYQEAIGKYLKRADAAKSEDDLFEPKRLILLLEERNRSAEVKILKDQLKQIKARLSKPILQLDDERIAIVGGREEYKDRYAEKLGKRFGGSYKWYDGVGDPGGKNLIKSLGQWKYTMVIFITGASKHDTFTPVHKAIKNLNENFGGSIREIVLGTSDVSPDSVGNGVQAYIANPKSANS